MNLYILVGKNPMPVDDVLEWGRWFEWMARHGARSLGRTEIMAKKPLRKNAKNKAGKRRNNSVILNRLNKYRTQDVLISTVFLALDHNYFGGKPILFESMIFGGKHDGLQWRYHSWDEAREGHEQILKRFT